MPIWRVGAKNMRRWKVQLSRRSHRRQLQYVYMYWAHAPSGETEVEMARREQAVVQCVVPQRERSLTPTRMT